MTAQRGLPASTSFRLYTLLRSRAFVVSTLFLTLLSLTFSFFPLFGLLGFEYSLFFGLFATITSTHFGLASMRHRARCTEGPSYVGTVTRILAAAQLSTLPALLQISLNALRIPNCNFLTGLGFFVLLPSIGVCFGTSVGIALAAFRHRRWPVVAVYLLPLFGVLWAVVEALRHPPIFVYNPFFGFYPGTIYDELRDITSTLVLYRLSTIGWALLLLSGAALFAGRGGLFDSPHYRWRLPFVQKDDAHQDGRIRLQGPADAFLGTLLLFLVALFGLSVAFVQRYDVGYKHDSGSIQRMLGGHLATPHFDLYYDRDSVSTKQIQRIARDHEFRYHQLRRFFGHRPKYRIKAYLFRDAKQKSRLMGADRTMIARPWAYEFYLHGYQFPHRVLKHEMAHVFSANFGSGPLKLSGRYGLLFSPAMIEGIATAADWSYGSLTPHQWSLAMLRRNRAPTPAQIIGPLGFFQRSSLRAYTIAGSFSRYLIDRYGMKRYKRAYGTVRFQAVYRKSLQQLSDEWKQFILTKVSLRPVEQEIADNRFRRYRSIFARVCAHEIASLRRRARSLYRYERYHQALRVQARICRLSPQPYNKLRYLKMLYDAKRFPEAEKLVKAMLIVYPYKKRPLLYAQLASIAGMLQYRRGEKKEATQTFKRLSQRKLPSGQKRAIYVRLHALTHPVHTKVILEYLDSSNKIAPLLALQRASLSNKQDPILSYLLGRRLFFAEKYDQALRQLKRIKATTLPLAMRAEIVRMLGISLFLTQHYRQAAQYFETWAALPLPAGIQNRAKDWKARALWEQKEYGRRP